MPNRLSSVFGFLDKTKYRFMNTFEPRKVGSAWTRLFAAPLLPLGFYDVSIGGQCL